MIPVPPEHSLVLSAMLFGIGLFGFLARKNAIAILASLELMLNAVSIQFLAFAARPGMDALSGHVFVVFIILISAAEAAVALAIFITLYRLLKDDRVEEIRSLKG
jgi:NADH:ubiquinone oxidoreductase subunit K